MRSRREVELESEVNRLRAEISRLKSAVQLPVEGQPIRAPESLAPIFDAATETVREYFSDGHTDPGQATIEFSGERYVLLRASSLSFEFLKAIQQLYADYGDEQATAIGRNFLFDISHVIGMQDAKNLHSKMGVTDPVAKLATGPVHFAYSGWAYVDISPESRPSPDDNYFLKYDHPFSFEADSWIRAGQKSDSPVCIMSCGYSSGWCEQSFGISLTAVELTCKAAGDETCTFIMAPPQRIEEHIGRLKEIREARRTSLAIPSFFERKRVEEEMKAARQKAEESDRMKSEFLANMSHEIRTPMNGVLGMIRLLQNTELTPLQSEYLTAAQESAESLLDIINEILDFSKLEAGATDLVCEPFSLLDLVRQTLKPFELRAEGKGIKVCWQMDPETPHRVFGDRGRLRQVIVNLLGNAIKFTEEGSVQFRIGLASQNSEQPQPPGTRVFYFRVIDTGIGIPEEKQQAIFQAFTQADLSTTKRFGGTGLGLTITSRLVNLMGGEIWCTSTENEGSTFHFTVRLEVDESSAIVDSETAGEPLRELASPTAESCEVPRGLRILVAEDGKVNQMLANALLTNWGHKVTLANNGQEAFDLWSDDPSAFDLILMDVLMPRVDGLQATRMIREAEQKRAQRTLIVAVTAQAMKGDREQCLEAGMDDYVSKPIQIEALNEVLLRAVRG